LFGGGQLGWGTGWLIDWFLRFGCLGTGKK